MIAVAASAERTMFRKPAASRGPAARSPPEPAGRRQDAYAQPSKPTAATVNVPAHSPIRSDPAHLAAKWDRQQPSRGCEAGGEEAGHPPVIGGPLREHPSRQPVPWYACQQKNTGGGQRVRG